ncbi:MAG: MBL fold metallo-hydrolase [Phycisphaerae bacterium]|nr:MBL fold metallo-hydrolase [Tepidisphaeraceae bacterium]
MKKPFRQDDSLLAEIHSTSAVNDPTARLWWLGQSGFLLQYRARHLVFDPYLSDSLTRKYADTAKPHVRISERVVAPEALDFVDVVTSTHNHTDHLDAETLVPLIRAKQGRHERLFAWSTTDGMTPPLILPAANVTFAQQRLSGSTPVYEGLCAWETYDARPFEITAVPAAHDQLTLDDLGRNVYVGFVVKAGTTVIYHSGDTVVYDGMADDLRPFNIDVALLPINGKVGNMSARDAARLAKDIGAKLVIPCHYDMFEFNTADPADEFVPECEHLGQPYRVLQQGERWSSDELAT